MVATEVWRVDANLIAFAKAVFVSAVVADKLDRVFQVLPRLLVGEIDIAAKLRWACGIGGDRGIGSGE